MPIFKIVFSPAAPVLVQNPGFEQATLPINWSDAFGNNLLTNTSTLANWTPIGATDGSHFVGALEILVVGAPDWTNTWWSGENIGYLFLFNGGPAGLEQTLGDVLQDNTDYSLGVLVGRRILDFGNNFGYDVQLLGGTTVLASGTQLSLAN